MFATYLKTVQVSAWFSSHAFDSGTDKKRKAHPKRIGCRTAEDRLHGRRIGESSPLMNMDIRSCDGREVGSRSRARRRRSPYLFRSHRKKRNNHASSPWAM